MGRLSQTDILLEVGLIIVDCYGLSELNDINHGYCYTWAAVVHRILPKFKLCNINTPYGHAVVRHGRKFYDAVNPKGCLIKHLYFSHNFQLPIIEEELYEEKTYYDFIKYWRNNGKYRSGTYKRSIDFLVKQFYSKLKK